MKKVLPFFLSLSFLLCGCVYAPVEIEHSPPIEYVDVSYEDMEIYRFLAGSITEDSSLEELMDAFSRMSEIPVDSSTNMYLYEVHPYEVEGTRYLYCHIVRQVDAPDSDEFIQLSLDITYLCEDDMEHFEEVTWFEQDADGFIRHIREGDLYKILIEKPICEYFVSISGT